MSASQSTECNEFAAQLFSLSFPTFYFVFGFVLWFGNLFQRGGGEKALVVGCLILLAVRWIYDKVFTLFFVPKNAQTHKHAKLKHIIQNDDGNSCDLRTS